MSTSTNTVESKAPATAAAPKAPAKAAATKSSTAAKTKKPAATETKAEASAGSVVHASNSGGLIPQGVANAMQSTANSVPPANEVVSKATAVPAVGATEGTDQEAPKQLTILESLMGTHFNELEVCLAFTLNLSDSRFYQGQAKALSKTKDASGNVVNLYSPFRKGPKDDKGAAAGVFHPLLGKAMRVLEKIKGSRILVAGKEKEVCAIMQKAVNAARAEIEDLFPKFSNDALIEAGVEHIGVRDVFHSTSWVNAEVTDSVTRHIGVINFIVNSGVVYDEEDPIKMIRSLETKLRMWSDKHPNVTILMGVALSIEDFDDGDVRNLVSMLLDEDGFSWFPKSSFISSLTNPEMAQTWAPKTLEGINKDLFPATADVLMVKVAATPEETAADDAAE